MADNAPSDAPAGADKVPAPESSPAAPAQVHDTRPDPAPPPASEIVVEGKLTERELKLQQERDAALARAKKAETDASYHQDEAHKLREALNEPKPKRTRSWMGFKQELD